jgi:hypothetical protein
VDTLRKSCGQPARGKNISRTILRACGGRRLWMASSRTLSLDPRSTERKIAPSLSGLFITRMTVHRFEQTIGGRAYFIEVLPVSNRWRAQLQRLPGMPTAMMPFYGQTPDEAARQLTEWLTLAHRRSLSSAV